jgi:hypothetical protein
MFLFLPCWMGMTTDVKSPIATFSTATDINWEARKGEREILVLRSNSSAGGGGNAALSLLFISEQDIIAV